MNFNDFKKCSDCYIMKQNEGLFKILKDMISDKNIPWKFRRSYYLKLTNYLESEVKK